MALSLLITYHDERELLTECLRSLAGQIGPEDEILIYDDASAYPAIDYLPAELPARVIRGATNVGPARGRNLLLQASQRPYVHFHDADDLFLAGWARQVRAALVEGRPDVVFTEVESYRGGERVSAAVLGLDRLAREGDLLRFAIQGPMLVPSGTYRRETVVAIGGYRTQLWQSEDYDFHIRLAASGVRHTLILEPLVRIRLRPAGRSANRREVFRSTLELLALQAGELPQAYHQELAEVAAQIGARLFQLGERADARDAFALARKLGPPTYGQQRRMYRALARHLGPEAAEWFSQGYRRLLPEALRRRVLARGWL